MRLIDADALELDSEWDAYYDGYISYSNLQIDCAETIDAESVRHGHWKWESTNELDLDYGGTLYLPVFVCSNCGHMYESYARYDLPLNRDADYPNYCEQCGAKMDEVSE